MKRLTSIIPLLLVAACASTPRDYKDTKEPLPEDFRESVAPEMRDGTANLIGANEFISGTGEVCGVIEEHDETVSVCRSHAGQRMKAADVISGSVER